MEILDDDDYVKSPYWKLVAQEDLPFLPTPMETIEYIFDYLSKHYTILTNWKLIDLGAGDGRVIIHAAEKYHIEATGVEINVNFIQGVNFEIEKRKLGHLCHMEEADLYAQNLQEYNIIWTFMLPTSHKYFKHVIETIKPGTIVIAVRWPLDTFEDMWRYVEIFETVDHFPVNIYVKN